jgi:hypothetical protein
MAQFAFDQFTGTTGTTLASHTPNTGGSWSTASGGLAQLTAAGRVRGSASGYADYRINGTPATADYDVSADFFFASMSATNNSGISGRADAITVLGSSASPAPSAGETHAVTLSMSGTSIAMFVDGTLISRVTDSSTSAKNLAGFFMQASAVPSDSIDLHFDNFTAADNMPPALLARPWHNPLLPQ